MYYIFILFFTLSVQDIQVSFSVFQRILMIFFMYSFLYTFLMKLTPKCIIFVFINWIYFLLFSNYLLLLECYAIEFKIFIFYFSILLSSLINPDFFFFFFFWPCCAACGILVPSTGIEHRPLVVWVPGPNHWTTREFQSWSFFSWGSWIFFLGRQLYHLKIITFSLSPTFKLILLFLNCATDYWHFESAVLTSKTF